MAGGARFTGGYPAILILSFGFWPAMVINLAATALYVLCLALMMYFINHVNCFVFMLAMKLISGYSTEFYVMGESVQFNLKYFLGLALLGAFLAQKILTGLAPRRSRPAPAAGRVKTGIPREGTSCG
jgi:hypothetical protein